ncbi:related to Ca2+-transporting ATPase [Fusarium fujikuroi IMI 58289]|uniref:P-type Na(+) transporter n=1 Tax=Gibberella fujikuroi (strain CBS 195.34 / IMI 58289 / NRRL A-6831) TaxID=1279085 RepID=S0EFG1_GIBF5|nr:related to Ca2+-transporting ATPase [Fusarium fujikuroi IMI 58289]CCT73499.1 related to Ca2+-transporting ATPase [Fusarium fujikuroi IMI 58289]SCO10705.1 related to Ca2+-transporting ATPase [Fusarium fujikuroi]
MAAEYPKHPFLLTIEETAQALDTSIDKGLTSQQVAEAQQKYPKNELDVGGTVPWYSILTKQLLNAMIIVLAFAMALSFGIKDYIEGGVLVFVIVLNVTIGFWQEYRAEKRMDALRALSSPSAMVLRDGKTQVISNPEVVPGDIVLLKMGDTVPADLRLFEAMNLACEEGQLTGESIPVEKITDNNITAPGTEKPVESEDEIGIGDRVNMAYATTVVRKGRGRGIVTATGMSTEVGKIAASTSKKTRKAGRSMNYKKYGKRQPFVGASKRTWDVIGKFLGLTEGTPLQRKLSALAYVLFGCAIILAIVVFAVNKFDMKNEVIIYATSLGIAIIPESLVAVLTITMVVAVTVMRKANVVVRDLSALEALGGVTNICSDKTGTLTEGAMIVRKAWIPSSHIYTVRDSQSPNDPTKGRVTYSKQSDEPEEKEAPRDYDRERSAAVLKFDVPDEKLNQNNAQPKKREPEVECEMTDELQAFLLSSALCNLATVRYDDEEEKWQVTGEPTEIALQVFTHRFNSGKKTLEGEGWKQIAEFPFDSSIKRMSVIYDAPEGAKGSIIDTANSMVFTKGAVERILDLCDYAGTGPEQQPMTDELKESVLEQMNSLASQGQRVLAIAYRPWDGRFTAKQASSPAEDEKLRTEVEQGLILLGLAGIYDPPRRETKPSIAECSNAGIRVHMLTGDHPETAKAIAKEVGIIPKNLSILPDHVAKSIVQKATDFDRMTDEEIDALEELPLVIARCAPDTKTRMIDALRRRGAFMAMTGDGVNDAPSLSRADVGIAMGSGSDVAKSASKIVLTDDKFNSIVAAIREGRRMFDNIQKFVLHLLTSNVGEVILLVCGLAFVDDSGFSVFPVSPLQIIWINMATSSFPAFGLGREQGAQDIMRKPPQDKKRGVFTNQIIIDMIVYGIIMGACTMCTFVIIVYGANGGNLGFECNQRYSEECIPVFKARAATFAELTWLILISAWEFKSLRRSVFRLNPDDDSKFPVFKDIYSNRFLFWSVIIGGLSVFPVVCIPVLNHKFFKHTGITWEWALAVGFTVVFVAGIELWKMTKRHFHLLEDAPVRRGVWGQGGEDGGRLARTMSLSSFKTWASFSRRDTGESLGKRSTSRGPTDRHIVPQGLAATEA